MQGNLKQVILRSQQTHRCARYGNRSRHQLICGGFLVGAYPAAGHGAPLKLQPERDAVGQPFVVLSAAALLGSVQIGLFKLAAKLQVITAVQQDVMRLPKMTPLHKHVQVAHGTAAWAGIDATRDAAVFQRHQRDAGVRQPVSNQVQLGKEGGHLREDGLVSDTPVQGER